MKTTKIRILMSLAAVFLLLVVVYVLDFGRIDTMGKIEFKSPHTSEDYMLSSLNVTAISQDRQKRIWIGTSAGLNVYDGQGYVQFFHDKKDTTALPDDYINVLHRDRAGNMWVGTQNGLARYEGGYRFRRYAIPAADGNITAIEDTKDATDPTTVLVGSGKQWYRVNRAGVMGKVAEQPHTIPTRMTERVESPLLSDSSLLQKPKELISSVFRDAGGNLWVGFHNAGYRVISSNFVDYTKANANRLANVTHGKDITSLERVGVYLLAGTTLRLYAYNTSTDRYSYILYRDLFDSSPVADDNSVDNATSVNTETVARQEVNDIVAFGDDKAWVINDNQIVSCQLEGNGMRIAGRTAAVGPSDRTLGTGVKAGDCLYVSCDGGKVIKSRFGSSAVESIHINNEWYGSDTQMTTLHNGDIMLFMRNMHVAILSTKTNQLTDVGLTLPDDDMTNISPAFALQDSYGNIWLGTRRSGLYRLRLPERSVERMTFVNDVHIQGMVEDEHRRLWITTLKDAICYEPATGAVLLNSMVSSSQNNWHRQFFDLSVCLTRHDNVVFGTSDGCIFLPAESGKLERDNSSLRITAIDIRNNGGEELTINDDIADGSKYTLAYDERAVTFRFFYPNYNRASSLMFQYMLEGYDQTWREPSYKNTAFFANLTPGNYTFRLRLISSPTLPPIATSEVHLRVKEAPWRSWAAWLFYAVCIGYVIYFLNSMYLKIRTDRMQQNFFANISHEFRNPITLIAGPLVSLSADESLPESVHKTLNIVCVSVNRMLRLIDQMLDFNQLETDALRLKVCEMDVAEKLHKMGVVFEESAKPMGITLTLDIADGNYNGFADPDKLEKIMSNLYTNALKHTPEGGHITISASTHAHGSKGNTLSVAVANSGSHISEDRLGDVFKRYYQLDSTHANRNYGWGTGIGLYYVRRLVGLHHGEIGVANTNGGVKFFFSIPIDRTTYTDAEMTSQEERVMQIPVASGLQTQTSGSDDSSTDTSTDITASSLKPKGTAVRRRKILIVDDDVDVAQYIRSLFEGDFDVENRYSAEAALKDMETISPDIIVSDIVMGEMSGYDFCQQLKANLMFCHIPIVLVTAKSNMDEQIKGLQLGAIAYVTKPFDPSYLRAIVNAQLSNLMSLRKRLGENTDTSTTADTLSEPDRKFMDELYALMEKHAADMDLNVATACHELLISQSKFTYKLRELTGDTPGNFFRKYKLNKGAKMLREGKKTVSEIAMLTGFSSAAHFSVAFKKQFGVTPSEYASGK